MQLRRAPITDRKLRFALVGCGRIAANHIAALHAHAEHAELVAVCDTDAAALHAAIGLHPGRAAGLRRVLATILEPLGRRPEAIAQLEAALAADPADQVAQSMLDRLRPPHRR